MADSRRIVPPLFVERALISATGERVRYGEIASGFEPPAHLGSLALAGYTKGYVRFDPEYDVDRITRGVQDDFAASYVMQDARAATSVRDRSAAWLDWLTQDTDLQVRASDYMKLATTAAVHGDAKTVRQILGKPQRLWLNKQAETPMDAVESGRLEVISTGDISSRVADIALLMAIVPEDRMSHVQTAILPLFRKIVVACTTRDVIHHEALLGRASRDLVASTNPKLIKLAGKLMTAMPMTSAKHDAMIELATAPCRWFAAADKQAKTWQQQRAFLAEQALVWHMKPFGATGRKIIDYPVHRTGQPAMAASQPIAHAIVDLIPNTTDATSDIETSVAYVHGTSQGGTVHGSVLHCVRTLLDNPHFDFANPRFGFAGQSKIDRNYRACVQEKVTIVDANLPRQLVIDLSSAPLVHDAGYDDIRFLCRLIQAEKDRRLDGC